MVARTSGHWTARALILLLLPISLAGCGWQLRDAPEVDALPELAITGAGNELRQELERVLENADVRVRSSAPWTLHVSNEDWTRRTVATDARGRAAEVELRLNLAWQLQPPDEHRGAPPARTLTLTRGFPHSPSDATSSSDEEELVRASMYRDAVRQILRQLEVTTARLPPQSEDADAAPE